LYINPWVSKGNRVPSGSPVNDIAEVGCYRLMVDRTTSSLPFSAEISDKYPVWLDGKWTGVGTWQHKGFIFIDICRNCSNHFAQLQQKLVNNSKLIHKTHVL